ncbi:PRC-barrel domain-containing protein [Methanogenium sp. S4BF]|uniref:PRC-barrel domain-containing protein n=1 Tax=Methanogenium sp. S4BF TaxID=1789226 RepID=UPI0024178035|nr:PRC-barrel domain-containing protein [Methanogenium sp. S4BF]WFN33766.1 PRC-barrel domain-containing protein [Methanogenium sp. S4BF]
MKSAITELFGMKVYTENAVYVGDVDDVIINVDTKKLESLALGNVNREVLELTNFKGVKIPYRIIRAVGDIVIIRHLAGMSRSEIIED